MRLKKVQPLDDYTVKVIFNRGTKGIVDMKNFIMSKKAGVLSALKNLELFKQDYLEYGVITWPGELDLSPDAMHTEIKKNGVCVLE